MGSKSYYQAKAVLDALFGSGTPATLYFGLFSVNPSGSTPGTELSGGGYARKGITNNDTNFPAASGGSADNGDEVAEKSNAGDIEWDEATGSQGTAVGFGVWDAATDGNLLYWGALTPNIAITEGVTFKIPAGELTITEG